MPFSIPRLARPAKPAAPPAKRPAPKAGDGGGAATAGNIVPLRKSPEEAHELLRTRLRRMAAEDTGGWAHSGLAAHYASASPDSEGEEGEGGEGGGH